MVYKRFYIVLLVDRKKERTTISRVFCIIKSYYTNDELRKRNDFLIEEKKGKSRKGSKWFIKRSTKAF